MHATISRLNGWLETEKINIMISRQPILGWSSVQPRRIQQFIEGNHGQAIFLNEFDVFHVHEADQDGDSVALEWFPSNELLDSMTETQQTEEYIRRDKQLNLNIVKKKGLETTITKEEDFGDASSSAAKSWGAEGTVTNAQMIANVLAYRQIRAKSNAADYYIEAKQPDDIVIPRYFELDENMSADEYNSIKGNGDRVVIWARDPETKEYSWNEVPFNELENSVKAGFELRLETTFEFEMKMLKQMAVDNVKHGYLTDAGYTGFMWVVKRMFKKTNAAGELILGELTKADRKVGNALHRLGNYSAMRHGRGKMYRESLTFEQNIADSISLADVFYDENGGMRTAEAISEKLLDIVDENLKPLRGSKKGTRTFKFKTKGKRSRTYLRIEEVLTNGNISPIESMLAEVGRRMSEVRRDNPNMSQDWLGSPIRFKEKVYKYAHIHAMKDMEALLGPLYTQILESGDKKRIGDLGTAVEFMDKMGNEFYSIYANALEKLSKNEDIERVVTIRYEYNEDFIKFMDKYLDDWLALTDEQRAYATLHFLSGVSKVNKKGKITKVAFALQLLPLKLMHSGIIKRYAPFFHKRLYDKNKKLPKESEARYGELAFNKMKNLATEYQICG